MTTAIIGGGLMGLTTADALLERGEDVIVVEQRDDVALGTSYANAGLLTPSHAQPWNNPKAGETLLKSFADSKSPLKLRIAAIPGLALWGAKFLMNSGEDRFFANQAAMFNISHYSQAELRAVRARLNLEYEQRPVGTLMIYRDGAALDASAALSRRLEPLGLRFEMLNPAQAVAREPMLSPIADEIAGAAFYPDDESGDAHLFCAGLRTSLEARGADLRFGVRVKRILNDVRDVRGIRTDKGFIKADRIVVAAGARSPFMLRKLAIDIPVRPVKGYSLTWDVVPEELPSIAVADDTLHAAMTPFGSRLRVAGTAEFNGFNRSLPKARIENLKGLLRGVYPELAQRLADQEPTPWTGFRPMSADGRPFVGPVHALHGLYVNTGHGHLGWTMACGSAALLADQITGRASAIDATPYRVER